MNTRYPASVIIQFTEDGEVIPLRIRIKDDDGEYQIFNVSGYTPIPTSKEPHSNSDGVFIMPNTKAFSCPLTYMGKKIEIHIYFNESSYTWFAIIKE